MSQSVPERSDTARPHKTILRGLALLDIMTVASPADRKEIMQTLSEQSRIFLGTMVKDRRQGKDLALTKARLRWLDNIAQQQSATVTRIILGSFADHQEPPGGSGTAVGEQTVREPTDPEGLKKPAENLPECSADYMIEQVARRGYQRKLRNGRIVQVKPGRTRVRKRIDR